MENRRMKNKQDMTIVEQLIKIRSRMCDECCKFPTQSYKECGEDINKATEYCMEKYCAKCALNELM